MSSWVVTSWQLWHPGWGRCKFYGWRWVSHHEMRCQKEQDIETLQKQRVAWHLSSWFWGVKFGSFLKWQQLGYFLKIKKEGKNTGWWNFNFLFVFIWFFRKMNPFWRSYFSKGLKPPTRITLKRTECFVDEWLICDIWYWFADFFYGRAKKVQLGKRFKIRINRATLKPQKSTIHVAWICLVGGFFTDCTMVHPGRWTAGTYSHHPWKERKMIWTKPLWNYGPC